MKLETSKKYLKRLDKLGIKQVGNGCFATVFQHPELKNVVVRYNEEPEPSYDRYVRKAMETQNPWLPRVFHVEHVELRHSTATFTFIEKLKHIKRKEEIAFTRSLLDCLPRMYFTDQGYGYNKDDFSFIDEIEDDMWMLIGKRHPDENFRAAFKIIRKLVMKGGGNFDFHSSNIMRRKDGQLVFTDPIAYGFTM